MGRVVTFADSPDVVSAVTMGETSRLSAEHLCLPPGHTLTDTVPVGSDVYLFVLTGTATLDASASHQVAAQAFAALPEGTGFSLRNDADTVMTAIKVTAPPHGATDLPGYAGPVTVTDRAAVAPVLIADQKKQRIYFVAPHAAVHSARAHAMIVVYDHDTVTDLHHHPDAESMFVLLEGKIEFVVDGRTVAVGPGQAAYFTVNDRHSLRVADGHTGAAFLEFHLPAAFSTVKAQPAT